MAIDLRGFYRVSAVVLVAQVVVALVGLTQVDAAADVPIHWGADGQPNGFASPIVAFFLIPLITLGLVGLLAAIPRIEPRREHLAASGDAYRAVAIGLVLFMAALQVVVVASAIDRLPISITALVGVGVGALFIVIGRAMRSIKSNFLFGVRTPWTLTSERSWHRTHGLVGSLFVVFGAVIAVATWLFPPEALIWVILIGIAVILVAAFGYSYVVWRGDPDRQSGPFAGSGGSDAPS